MFSRWLLFTMLLVSFAPLSVLVHSGQPINVPYIYYYSDRLNAFVIERADGTDTRLMAQRILARDTNSVASYIGGPGFSPSGGYFAYTAASIDGWGRGYENAQPAILNLRTGQQLDVFNGWQNVRLAWSSEADLLLAVRYYYARDLVDPRHDLLPFNGYRVMEVAVINANAGVRLFTAKQSFPTESDETVPSPQIKWNDARHIAIFFQNPYTEGMRSVDSVLAARLDIEGGMTITSANHVEIDTFRANIGRGWDAGSPDVVSPDGRFTAVVNDGTAIRDNRDMKWRVLRPALRSYNAAPGGTVIWNNDSKWLMDFREGLLAGGGACCYHVGIATPDGAMRRDLTKFMQPLEGAAAGWLPPNVAPSLFPLMQIHKQATPSRVLHGKMWSFNLLWSADKRALFGAPDGLNNFNALTWLVDSGTYQEVFVPIGKTATLKQNKDGSYSVELIPEDSTLQKWKERYVLARDPINDLIVAFSSSDGYVVYRESTSQPLHILSSADRNFSGFGISPDGKLLAFSGPYERNVLILNTSTWKVVASIDHPAPGVAFSPDGKQLAVTASWDVEIYNVSDLLGQ